MVIDIANSISRYLWRRSAGLLILRLMTGTIFVLHGAMKVSAITIVAGFFSHLGLEPGLWFAWGIAVLEIVGGLALVFGVATRVFGVIFGIEMIAAVFLTGIGRGFAAHEFELLLAASSIAIALAGSGRWSLLRLECARCGGIFCDGETCTLQVE